MPETKPVEKTAAPADFAGPYTIYSAGGLFTQHELATNIALKEAVWRLSGGKYQLFLPQSRELQELDRPDVKAHIRNTDLLEVIKADIILARFDGLELESGTVVEFIVAKTLGKPALILRSDFRRMYGTGLAEPYNLMVKNWPRSVEVHLDCFVLWAGLLTEARRALDNSDPFQAMLSAETSTAQRSTDEIAQRVIDGLEALLELESPYPPDYQELVYRAARFSIGGGFDQLLPADQLEEMIARLRNNGTL